MNAVISFNIHNLRQLLRNPLRMASVTMQAIKQNAELTKATIALLKEELNTLSNDYNSIRAQQLREENAQLLAAVEAAKRRLVLLEVKNGVKQIPLPAVKVESVEESKEAVQDLPKTDKPKKEKKVKEVKKEKDPPAGEPAVDVGRLDLRVAKIEDVQRHPDADTLYLLKINCGEDKPRTVCSGLVKFVALEELKDRSVVLLCNLKPVKMRGIMSEAMVMCASTHDKVEVLLPPKGCAPGDLVHCEGYTRQPDAVMNPKKKIFETVAPDLHTNDSLQACYKGVPFTVLGKGHVLAQTLKNVIVK